MAGFYQTSRFHTVWVISGSPAWASECPLLGEERKSMSAGSRINRVRHPGTNNRRPARILGRNRASSETFSVHLLLRDLGGASRICRCLRHGFWMPKLRVVELRICGVGGGFGRGDQGFVLPGCSDFWDSVGVLTSGQWPEMIRRVSSRVLICTLAIMGRGSILPNAEQMPQGAGPDFGGRQVPTSFSVWR